MSSRTVTYLRRRPAAGSRASRGVKRLVRHHSDDVIVTDCEHVTFKYYAGARRAMTLTFIIIKKDVVWFSITAITVLYGR